MQAVRGREACYGVSPEHGCPGRFAELLQGLQGEEPGEVPGAAERGPAAEESGDSTRVGVVSEALSTGRETMEQGDVGRMSDPRHYLEQHPTPWRIIGGLALDHVDPNGKVDPNRKVKTAPVWGVVDANNVRVLPDCEPSTMVEELVDFINAVGPSLPRLMQISREEVMRREFERRWADIELTDGDKRRIADGVRERFGGGV